MCFNLTILWKHTLFLGYSLLVQHLFEGWGEILLKAFFQKERGLFEAVTCFYMHFLQIWYTMKRKKINLMTKSEGNFFLREIFDFEKEYAISDEIVFLRNHLQTENFYL